MNTHERRNHDSKRAKLRELALSDRDTAPVYYELYIERYGEAPDGEGQS